MALVVKSLPAMQETWGMQVWSLGWEDPLEQEMATHSSILAWRIPWTEEPGQLLSIGSQRVWHDWSNLASVHKKKKRWNLAALELAGSVWFSLCCTQLIKHDHAVWFMCKVTEFLHLGSGLQNLGDRRRERQNVSNISFLPAPEYDNDGYCGFQHLLF